jgi:hypothetical protein
MNTAGQEKLFNSFFLKVVIEKPESSLQEFSLKAPARQIRLVSIHYNISFIFFH